MIKKYKKVCRDLNYIYYYLLILTSTITECIPISYIASLVGIPLRIISSATGLQGLQLLMLFKKL